MACGVRDTTRVTGSIAGEKSRLYPRLVKCRICVITFVVIALLGVSGAWGLDPHKPLTDFLHREWLTNDGAPADGITAFVQTADGYIWVAGRSGNLYRFDGVYFERMEIRADPRLASTSVFSLLAPASGGLWLGLTFGGAVLIKDSHMTVYGERDGLPPGTVRCMEEDADGHVWLATTGGIAHQTATGWQTFKRESTSTNTAVQSMLFDSQGTLWLSYIGSAAWTTKGSTALRRIDAPVDGPAFFSESPDGTIWMHDQCGKRMRAVRRNVGGAGHGRGLIDVFDRDGALWAGTCENKLFRIANFQAIASRDVIELDELPASIAEVRDFALFVELIEDREGNIWAGGGLSLHRFADSIIVFAASAPDNVEVGIAPAPGGAVWVSFNLSNRSSADPLALLHDRELRPAGPAGNFTSLLAADDGSYWFANDDAILHYSSGRFAPISRPPGTEDAGTQAMAIDRAGALWASVVRRGVFVYEDGKWLANGGLALPAVPALSVASDSQGRIWLGYADGRLTVVAERQARQFPVQQGPRVGAVTALYGRRGHQWIGGDFGLSLFDGQRFHAVTGDSLQLTKITGIVETATGDLWMNCSSGIVHIPATEVRRVLDGNVGAIRAETFNALDGFDGLAPSIRPHPTVVEGTDGRLWFTSNVGIFTIDPTHPRRSVVAPLVHIQSIQAGNRTYAPAGSLTLPKLTTALRIKYVALSLKAPEKVQYRYRLGGVNTGWVDGQSSREAFLTDLRPGTYQFEVAAANGDGVWSKQAATLQFVIPPAFTQTPWFVLVCLLAIALVIYLTFRLRIRQIAARTRSRLEERMNERERIARDLHDTLLQGVQGVVFKIHAVTERLPDTEPVRASIRQALDRAEDVIREARDRVSGLRGSRDTTDLVTALTSTANTLAAEHNVKFQSLVRGQAIPLHPVVADESLLLASEALANAFRHAKAAHVELEVIYQRDEFAIRVRDDGVGIDELVLWRGSEGNHFGLVGMRERARRMRARLDIWTRSGAGTEVDLRVSGEIAYGVKDASRRRPRLSHDHSR
jgi:signal transduction histidine kinase/ligand-binding sensor domain-containing protein